MMFLEYEELLADIEEAINKKYNEVINNEALIWNLKDS